MTYIPSHIGPFLKDKPPSLWVCVCATAVNPKTGVVEPYILMRDPLPSRSDKDNASFAHPMSGSVRPDEIVIAPNGEKVFDFDQVAGRIVSFFSGVTIPTNREAKRLHHEGTSVFSGYQENQQVIFAMTDIGHYSQGLPPIVTTNTDENGEEKPRHGQNVTWVNFHELMESVTQHAPLNADICAPNRSPFTVANPFKKDGSRMIIQASVLYFLERAAKHILPDYEKKFWVPDSHVANTVKIDNNGLYADDDRDGASLPAGRTKLSDNTKLEL